MASDPSIRNVLDQRDLKWIFVGGKGGVGKTTCSCCLAVLLAQVRSSVLIISTDPAHNLSDAFRQKFSRSPAPVQGFTNLFAMEIDPSMDEDAVDFLGGGADGLMSDLVGAIPGIDEAMSFAEMLKLVQSMDYDVVVFDTAPTGHTLRLLELPSTLDKGLSKMISLKGKFSGMLQQMSSMFGGGDMFEEEQLLGKLDGIKAVVSNVNAQFRDPKLTTFVCVCIAEFLSLYETERLIQDLAKFEIDTRNIIINQVIMSKNLLDPLLRARMDMQNKYIRQYHDLYEDFHIIQLPLQPEELRGVDSIKDFAKHMLVPYQPPPADFDTAEGWVLTLEREVQALKVENARLKDELNELKATV